MGGSEDDEKPRMNGKFCKTKMFPHKVGGDGTVKSLVRAGKDGEFIHGSPKK